MYLTRYGNETGMRAHSGDVLRIGNIPPPPRPRPCTPAAAAAFLSLSLSLVRLPSSRASCHYRARSTASGPTRCIFGAAKSGPQESPLSRGIGAQGGRRDVSCAARGPRITRISGRAVVSDLRAELPRCFPPSRVPTM